MSKRGARRKSKHRTKAAPTQQAPKQPVNLAEEYRYVTEDLQRIGIIAAILISLLIIARVVMIVM